MKPDHEHAKHIEAWGGAAVLAKEISEKERKAGRKVVSRQTVQGWKKRGIPARVQLRHSWILKVKHGS